ncbi:MAG: hypothetical protein LBJ00_04245 [Planctomycetaceae bacterium]|jgi:hypothetical protein|nr:hypothetical protein [Planctomycetaceae bacterium]
MPLICKVERVGNHEMLIKVQLNVDDRQTQNSLNSNIVLDFGEEGLVNVPVVYQVPVRGE